MLEGDLSGFGNWITEIGTASFAAKSTVVRSAKGSLDNFGKAPSLNVLPHNCSGFSLGANS
jgi:hypothetical protein